MAKVKYDPEDWKEKSSSSAAPDGTYQMQVNAIFYNVKDDGSFPRYTVLLGHTEENAAKYGTARTTLFLPTEEKPGLGRKFALFLSALGVSKEEVESGAVDLDNDGKSAVIRVNGDVIDTKKIVMAKLSSEEYNGTTRNVADYVVKAK